MRNTIVGILMEDMKNEIKNRYKSASISDNHLVNLMEVFIFKRDNLYNIQKCSWCQLNTLEEVSLTIYYDEGWKISIVKSNPNIKVDTNDLIDYMIKDISKDVTNRAFYTFTINETKRGVDSIALDQVALKETLLALLNVLNLHNYTNIIFE